MEEVSAALSKIERFEIKRILLNLQIWGGNVETVTSPVRKIAYNRSIPAHSLKRDFNLHWSSKI